MTNTDRTLIMRYNLDSNNNTMAVKIDNEAKQISPLHYCVQLQQIADEQHRMVVVDDLGNELIEVYNMDEIKENNYYINYTSSVVYFHPSKAGKTFIFNYYGLGIELISASRIYDETTWTGEFIIKTIQEIIDKGRECINALSTIGDAVKLLQRIENYIIVATELDIKLREDIATGNQLIIDLNNTIQTGSQLNTDLGVTINTANTSKTELETTTTNANNKKIELEGTISTANTSKTNLENATATADAKKTELDTSIANAQDDINTINAKGNDSYIVLSTNWVGTEPNLTYTLNHGLNSKNLIVGAINDDTKFSSMPDFKYIDMNTIELQSTTRSNITVSINANYYSGKDANTIAQEVIDARDGEVSLKGKIENINTNINALNNEIITARGSDLTLDERLNGIDLDITKNAIRINDITINVKDFGAKGDGVTDDTQAIQSAIDFLKPIITSSLDSYQSGGGTVFLPIGVYRITNTLRLYSNVKILGSGRQLFGRTGKSTVIMLDSSDVNKTAVSFVGLDPITKTHSTKLTVTGIELDDGTVTQTWNSSINELTVSSKLNNNVLAINFSGCPNCKLSNFSFENFDVGIYSSGNWSCCFDNIYGLANFAGVVSNNGNTLKIENIYINPSTTPKSSLASNSVLYSIVNNADLLFPNTQSGIISLGTEGLSIYKPIIEKLEVSIQLVAHRDDNSKNYVQNSIYQSHFENNKKQYAFNNVCVYLNGLYCYADTSTSDDFIIKANKSLVTGINLQSITYRKLIECDDTTLYNFTNCSDNWQNVNKISYFDIGKSMFLSYNDEAIYKTWQTKKKTMMGDTVVENQYIDLKEVTTCEVNSSKLNVSTTPEATIDVKYSNTVLLNSPTVSTVYGFTARDMQEFTVISMNGKTSLNGNESGGTLKIKNGIIDPIPINGVIKFICVNGVCYEISRSF